jgi:hypothetical protein
LRGNHVGTALWVGSTVNNSPNFTRNLGVHIEHNRIDNVTASGTQANTNSGVGIDVRETAEAVIRNNIVRNVLNTAGHVDSNGVYAKSSVRFENNFVANCGADARGLTTGEAGSEGSLLTFKGNSRCHSTIRNNIFEAGTRTDVPMILMTQNATLDGNRFEDWRYSGDHMTRDSMIRSYSGGPVLVTRPAFVNCGTAPGNAHRGYAMGEARGGTMLAEDFRVAFDGERTDIFNGDVAIENCFNLEGMALTVGHEPDADAVIAAASMPLNQTQGVAMDFLVRDLKFRDIWPKLRALNLLHAADAAMASVDWRFPSRVLTATGAPEFIPFSGYRATADGQKLSTGYNPVADDLPASDCMLMVAVDGNDVRSNRNVCGNAGLSLVVRNTTPADAHTARIASGVAANFPEPVASAPGVHAVQRRNSATLLEHFKDGNLLGTAAMPAVAHHDSVVTLLGRADVEGTAPYTVWAFAIGQSLTPSSTIISGPP